MPSPHIVVSLDLPNQTAEISQTDLFVSVEGGLYRISAYLEVSSLAANPSQANGSISYTDDYGSSPKLGPSVAITSSTSSRWSQATFIVKVAPNTAIRYEVSAGGGTVSAPYNFYIRVEHV